MSFLDRGEVASDSPFYPVVVDLHLGALTTGSTDIRHLNLAASELGLGIEMLKDADVDFRAKLSVMDIKVEDRTKSGLQTAPVTILSRTMPPNLVRPHRLLSFARYTNSSLAPRLCRLHRWSRSASPAQRSARQA